MVVMYLQLNLLNVHIFHAHIVMYTFNVRFVVDLVVCCALGVDMYDCVFPTRTAVSVPHMLVLHLKSYGHVVQL